MSFGDQLIALGLLAIIAFVVGEIMWRARIRRWRIGHRRPLAGIASPRRGRPPTAKEAQ